MNTRRKFLQRAVTLGSGLFAAPRLLAKQHPSHSAFPAKGDTGHSHSEKSPAVIQTPDVADLPFRLDNGVKEFHLIAEPVKQELMPGKTMDLWGFNGSAPGPTIQVNQGDRVRII